MHAYRTQTKWRISILIRLYDNNKLFFRRFKTIRAIKGKIKNFTVQQLYMRDVIDQCEKISF